MMKSSMRRSGFRWCSVIPNLCHSKYDYDINLIMNCPLIHSSYLQVHIHKPVCSKPGNSEVYVVCKSRVKTIPDKILPLLRASIGMDLVFYYILLCQCQASFPLSELQWSSQTNYKSVIVIRVICKLERFRDSS